jgi:predicted esterase
MRALVAVVACVVACLVSRVAEADPPCPGCLLSLPEGDGPVPLIVALHGDGQAPAQLHAAWTSLAKPRGIAVLTVACPAAQGCKGSFWRWGGDPSFVTEAVAKVGARRRVDEDRLWLVGWSGGGSYIGWRAQAFQAAFAAIVVHGGGMPPEDPACAETATPVYFLVGDKNPLHHLAVRLRDHFAACKSDVRWDLVAGADHPAEWGALPRHGNAIVDWLVAHPRVR